MRSLLFCGLASAWGVLALTGCQHLAPEPLDLHADAVTLGARSLDVAPVRAYAAALATPAGDAAAFDLSDGLSLREGQAVALWYNLDLRVARLEAAESAAVAGAAGRWADPVIGLEGGEKSEDTPGGGFLGDAGGVDRSWVNAASFSITIPLSGRLWAERALRRSELDAAQLRVVEAEWATITAVREAWSRWSASQARVALLDEHLALLQQFSEVADALSRAGELGPTTARLFSIEYMRRTAARAREVFAEEAARTALIELLGLLPDAPVELVAALDVDAPAMAAETTPASHPSILRLCAAYQAAEDRLRVELRKQYPDITLSPRYTEEEDESTLLLGLGVPVPVWNANRAGIAEAAAARDTARARAVAAYQHLIAEVAQATSALRGSQAERRQLLDAVAPAVDAQIAETQTLLSVGEIDIVVLYETLGQALETKLELLNATLAESLAAARLTAALASGAINFDAPLEVDE